MSKGAPTNFKIQLSSKFSQSFTALIWDFLSRCDYDYDYDYDDYDDGDDDNLFVTCDLPFPFHSGAPEWLFDAIVPFLERKITSLYKYNTSLHTSLHK